MYDIFLDIKGRKIMFRDKPSAWWGFRCRHFSGKNSEGNRFITNKDL